MADRVRVQVIFKKFLWLCPACGQEDVDDANVGSENVEEHDCSVCQAHFVRGKRNPDEHTFCINYTLEEYEKLTAESLANTKSNIMNSRVAEIKNPPVYQEPSVEVLEELKAEKQAEVDRLQTEINAKTLETTK